MDDDWREIPDFPKYGVSREGEVANLRSGTTLKISRNQAGLAKVGLVRDGKQYTKAVALLVAEAFLEKQFPHFDTPIHLNGDRMDCRAENLMWRPLWFARKYHAQFYFPHFRFGTPHLEIVETGERFHSYMEPCCRYGLIAYDITKSCLSGDAVYPGRYTFRKVE